MWLALVFFRWGCGRNCPRRRGYSCPRRGERRGFFLHRRLKMGLARGDPLIRGKRDVWSRVLSVKEGSGAQAREVVYRSEGICREGRGVTRRRQQIWI